MSSSGANFAISTTLVTSVSIFFTLKFEDETNDCFDPIKALIPNVLPEDSSTSSILPNLYAIDLLVPLARTISQSVAPATFVFVIIWSAKFLNSIILNIA